MIKKGGLSKSRHEQASNKKRLTARQAKELISQLLAWTDEINLALSCNEYRQFYLDVVEMAVFIQQAGFQFSAYLPPGYYVFKEVPGYSVFQAGTFLHLGHARLCFPTPEEAVRAARRRFGYSDWER